MLDLIMTYKLLWRGISPQKLSELAIEDDSGLLGVFNNSLLLELVGMARAHVTACS